jgi:arginyl-tRNA synthetase
VLAASGYSVQREYYVNDAGGQIDAFYRSMYARYQQAFGQPAEIPEDGYRGDYVVELARQIIAEEGDLFSEWMEGRRHRDRQNRPAQGHGVDRADLELIGVSFDVWFSEKSLYEGGQYEKTMSLLRREATWQRGRARSGSPLLNWETTRTTSWSAPTERPPISPQTWPITTTSSLSASLTG